MRKDLRLTKNREENRENERGETERKRLKRQVRHVWDRIEREK